MTEQLRMVDAVVTVDLSIAALGLCSCFEARHLQLASAGEEGASNNEADRPVRADGEAAQDGADADGGGVAAA